MTTKWKDWDKQYRARFIAKRNSCTISEQLVDRDEEKKETGYLKLAQQSQWIDIELDPEFDII